MARINAELGRAQRELRSFDEEHYVPDRAPLQLGSLQSLPTPGRVELGADRELQMYPADGHTADGAAYWLPWAKVLVCGDYLSPVEIPMLSPGGSLPAYRQTLARLAGLITQAEWVIPGHGAPISAQRAQEVLVEDDAYLEQPGPRPGRGRAARRPGHRRPAPDPRRQRGQGDRGLGAARPGGLPDTRAWQNRPTPCLTKLID